MLDAATDKPVPGAKVKLKLSDGSELNAVSNAKGEASIDDGESYEGVSVKVIVSHPGYKEKWSDMPPELLMAEDTDTRLFTVFLDPKAKTANWVGTWIYDDKHGTVTLSGSGSSVSANATYAISDWKSISTISGCREAGDNKLACRYSGNYEDPDKTVISAGKVELTLSGDQISSVWTEIGEPKISWKPGRPQYSISSAWHDGQVWRNTFYRK